MCVLGNTEFELWHECHLPNEVSLLHLMGLTQHYDAYVITRDSACTACGLVCCGNSKTLSFFNKGFGWVYVLGNCWSFFPFLEPLVYAFVANDVSCLCYFLLSFRYVNVF